MGFNTWDKNIILIVKRFRHIFVFKMYYDLTKVITVFTADRWYFGSIGKVLAYLRRVPELLIYQKHTGDFHIIAIVFILS